MTFDEMKQLLTHANPANFHQHPNGGGWVEKTATVGSAAYISGLICEGANIGERANIGKLASIGEGAKIGEGAIFSHSILCIQGSRDLLNVYSVTEIAIGCEIHSVEVWLRDSHVIGKEHGYTAAQCAEYRTLLTTAADWMRRMQLTAKKTKNPS